MTDSDASASARPAPAAAALPQTLRTRALVLRPFCAADADAVYAYWLSDPGWERFNESVPTGFDAADARAFVGEMIGRDRDLAPSWALVHQTQVVGVVSLRFEVDHHSAVLGFGIHAGLRGRGLCAEAAGCILDAAFSRHGELEVVRAHTDAANHPSMRVLHKLGFSSEEADRGASFRLDRSVWKARRGR